MKQRRVRHPPDSGGFHSAHPIHVHAWFSCPGRFIPCHLHLTCCLLPFGRDSQHLFVGEQHTTESTTLVVRSVDFRGITCARHYHPRNIFHLAKLRVWAYSAPFGPCPSCCQLLSASSSHEWNYYLSFWLVYYIQHGVLRVRPPCSLRQDFLHFKG